EPFVGLVRRLVENVTVFETIEATGLDSVLVRGVDLGLVPPRERRPELSAEVLSAIAVVIDHGLNAVTEVVVIAALAEEVSRGAGADEDAVLPLPLGFVSRVSLPAGKVLAVE